MPHYKVACSSANEPMDACTAFQSAAHASAMRRRSRDGVPEVPTTDNPPMLALPAIRLATAADAPGIARMSRDWIEHGLGWSWTAGRIRQAMVDPSTNVAVLVPDTRVQGFGIMQYLQDDAAHLVLLAVAPVLRHQGLGRQLLAWLEATALAAGNTEIRLECRADNVNAIAFYRRLGYRETGRVQGYYEGRVDAVRMARRWSADGPV